LECFPSVSREWLVPCWSVRNPRSLRQHEYFAG
jgi:hypothetical protein